MLHQLTTDLIASGQAPAIVNNAAGAALSSIQKVSLVGAAVIGIAIIFGALSMKIGKILIIAVVALIGFSFVFNPGWLQRGGNDVGTTLNNGGQSQPAPKKS